MWVQTAWRREGSRTLKSPTAPMWWMFIICCVCTLYECDHSSILIISLQFFSGEHSYIITALEAHFLHQLFIIKFSFLWVIKGHTQHYSHNMQCCLWRFVLRLLWCFLQRFQMWPLLCLYILVFLLLHCPAWNHKCWSYLLQIWTTCWQLNTFHSVDGTAFRSVLNQTKFIKIEH